MGICTYRGPGGMSRSTTTRHLYDPTCGIYPIYEYILLELPLETSFGSFLWKLPLELLEVPVVYYEVPAIEPSHRLIVTIIVNKYWGLPEPPNHLTGGVPHMSSPYGFRGSTRSALDLLSWLRLG